MIYDVLKVFVKASLSPRRTEQRVESVFFL